MLSFLTKPAVSIIIPVYNAEQYLEETLRSALQQSLKNIELICIDDGSTDTSLQILSRFKKADRRIRIITQSNAGAGPARNAGLQKARGTYIAFLDADDLYPDPSCLQKLYTLAVRHKARIAGGSLLFLEDGQLRRAVVAKNANFTFSSTQMMQYKDLQQAYYYQRFLYSRDMLRKANIAFPAYRRFQDVLFFVKAMMEAGEFLATDMPTYIYRKSNNYISLTDAQINDMLKGYIDVLKIAKANDFSELFSFLARRISVHNSIGQMVESSIQGGNKTAEKLYSEVRTICNAPAENLRPFRG